MLVSHADPDFYIGLEVITDAFPDANGSRFELPGGSAVLPDRHYLWNAEHRAIIGGVLLFQQEHVWVADTATPEQRAACRAVRAVRRFGVSARRGRGVARGRQLALRSAGPATVS